MIKNILLILLILLISGSLSAEMLTQNVSAEAAVLINAVTGEVLFEKNKDKELYPASITKVATALYILNRYGNKLEDKVIAKKGALASITENAKRQSRYRAPAFWLETDGTHIGIKPGEEFYLKDLMYALLIGSANDAANVMAEHLEGDIARFVEKLNGYLKELGCTKTNFLNPHGLHHPHHKTTAHDMALIAQKAMDYPLFREIVALSSYKLPKTNLSEERLLVQTNHMVRKGTHFYKKATGIKTGAHSLAKKTLVSSASDANRSVIGVVLGCETNADRYKDMASLFNAAFNEKKRQLNVFPAGPQKVKIAVPHGKKALKTYTIEPLTYNFYPSERKDVKVKAHWSLPKLPIKQGQLVGKLTINNKDTTLSFVDLYALEDIEPALFYKALLFFKSYWKWLLLTPILLFFRRKKRHQSSSSSMFN